MVRKSQPNSGKQNLSVTPQAPAQTSSNETVREAIMRELSTNPKWKEDKTSGKVSVIVGHGARQQIQTDRRSSNFRLARRTSESRRQNCCA